MDKEDINKFADECYLCLKGKNLDKKAMKKVLSVCYRKVQTEKDDKPKTVAETKQDASGVVVETPEEKENWNRI